ncbi:MAG: cytochrome c biogenesis protein CcsA [Henriciella sp.]|nr:cytochrome c biogenesis protein CcsA [Henriciella sp.]
MWSFLANPHRFMGFSRLAVPICFAIGALLIGWSLYNGLMVVPPDEAQGGDLMRAMFTHVPSAWLCMGLYAGLAAASFVWFVWRHELADVAARAIAPIGAGYTALCFVTGAIWGQKGWGQGWHNLILGDSRLMSVLVLFFLFLGYIALRAAMETRQKAAKAGAILAMVGLINVPIIKVSVDLWETTTIHQPSSVIRIGGAPEGAEAEEGQGMNPMYLQQLLWGFGGHGLLASALIFMLMRAEIYSQRSDRLLAARLEES